jgi:hypothetical protein
MCWLLWIESPGLSKGSGLAAPGKGIVEWFMLGRLLLLGIELHAGGGQFCLAGGTFGVVGGDKAGENAIHGARADSSGNNCRIDRGDGQGASRPTPHQHPPSLVASDLDLALGNQHFAEIEDFPLGALDGPGHHHANGWRDHHDEILECRFCDQVCNTSDFGIR